MKLLLEALKPIVGLSATFRLSAMNGIVHSSKAFTYEDAIYALNGLQSNASVLEMARKEREANPGKRLAVTEQFLERLRISPSDLNRLNVIHISGTKGKGSTCAFVESILRHQGLKTGFYSSPHLVFVRERIRINGEPLSKEVFSSYFWEVYNQLKLQQVHDEPMPFYFMFLTIMAFYVFVHEKVDVAVIEVGIGGLYDSTNVVRCPVVVGVTSLGLDHVNVLGHTIEEIAWQKAGIFKPGVPAYTVSQPPEAMSVLQKKAREVNCPLYVVPPLVTYNWERTVQLGVPGYIQGTNASLALQLCRKWINHFKTNSVKENNSCNEPMHLDTEHHQLPPPLALPFLIGEKFSQGLQNCVWPGRFQIIRRDTTTYFLDGAHTTDSMEHCVKWYNEACQKEQINKKNVYRILLFCCTGERKAENLFSPLINYHFDLVMFTPSTIYTIKDAASDHSNFKVDPGKELEKCEVSRKMWHHLLSSIYEEEISSTAMGNSSTTYSMTSSKQVNDQTASFQCLSDALQWIAQSHDTNLKNQISPSISPVNSIPKGLTNADHLFVLVTGSLHLVGNVLSLIDPELSSGQKINNYI